MISTLTTSGGALRQNCSGKNKAGNQWWRLGVLEGLKGNIYAHTSGGGVEGRALKAQNWLQVRQAAVSI